VNLETNQSETIRQYLLGLVPDEELPAIDERLVTDGEFYDELLIVESELIDQYLSDELSTVERQKFESHFLVTPERLAQVRFAKSFHRYLDDKAPAIDSESVVDNAPDGIRDVDPPPPKPWYYSFLPLQNPVLAYSFVAALVLIVGGLSWAGWNKYRNPTPLDLGKIYIAELTPGGPTRSGGEEKKITLPTGTNTLELRLAVAGDEYRSYRAVLVEQSGSEVWKEANLTANSYAGAKFVTANVPVRFMPAGLYRLKLTGRTADNQLEDLPSYAFRLIR